MKLQDLSSSQMCHGQLWMKLLTSIHTLPNTDTDSGPQLHSSSRHYRVEKERLNVETQVNLSTNHRANAPLCKSKIEKKTSAHVDVPTSTTLVSREGKGIGIPCSFQPTLVHASAHVKEKHREKTSSRVAHSSQVLSDNGCRDSHVITSHDTSGKSSADYQIVVDPTDSKVEQTNYDEESEQLRSWDVQASIDSYTRYQEKVQQSSLS